MQEKGMYPQENNLNLILFDFLFIKIGLDTASKFSSLKIGLMYI